jgi:Zn-dependent protease
MGETMTQFLIRASMLVVLVPAVVIVHELGHALMAGPAGFRVTSFGVGRGRPIWRVRLQGGVVFWIGGLVIAGGSCVAVPRGLGTGPRAVLFHAGGLMAQGLLAGLLLMLPDWWWVAPLARFNVVLAVWNLFPWRLYGAASDGWWILNALGAGGGATSPLLARRAVLARMKAFEERVGSPVGCWYAGLVGAWIDLQVGHVHRAGVFFEQDHAETVLDPSLETLYQYVLARWHLACERPLAAMNALRQLRHVHGPGLPDDAQDLVALGLARVWVALGEERSAMQELAWLAGIGGLVGQEATVVQLEAALGEGNPDAVALAGRRLSGRLRASLLEPVAAVAAVWEAAMLLEDVGRLDESADLARSAIQAASRLLSSASGPDRGALVRRLGVPAGIRATGS